MSTISPPDAAIREERRNDPKMRERDLVTRLGLNLTAHFADHVILMNRGRVHASGDRQTVLTLSNLETAYRCPMAVEKVPAGMDFFHAAADRPN